MNSQPVLKTDEGIVLMSSGGRVIKAAYEFGKAFQNRMGLNNYIEIKGLDLIPTGQFIQWCYVPYVLDSGNRPMFNYYRGETYRHITFLHHAINQGYVGFGAGSPAYGSTVIAAAYNNATSPFYLFNSAVYRNDLSGSARSNYKKETQFSKAFPNDANISRIWVGAGRIGATGGVIPTTYAASDSRFNVFAYFNRELPDSEFLYAYGNGNGNEFQTLSGCLILLYCDKAEILDFSALQDGSDMRVGCRDYSGYNCHGEIMNLPAGTLQQKCDYANANLFVPFI